MLLFNHYLFPVTYHKHLWLIEMIITFYIVHCCFNEGPLYAEACQHVSKIYNPCNWFLYFVSQLYSVAIIEIGSCIVFYTVLFPNKPGLIWEPQCIFHGDCSHTDKVLQWRKGLFLFQHTSNVDHIYAAKKWASIH